MVLAVKVAAYSALQHHFGLPKLDSLSVSLSFILCLLRNYFTKSQLKDTAKLRYTTKINGCINERPIIIAWPPTKNGRTMMLKINPYSYNSHNN